MISGASGGLARALVKEYSAPGVGMLMFGRDEIRLKECANLAEASGADVTIVACSSSNRELTEKAIRQFDTENPVDLLICLAGTKTGNEVGIEAPNRLESVFDTNLVFPAFLTQCILPGMKRRNVGQIALISSLAAIAPHPDLISYSASKAGLRAFGISLRRSLAGTGVSVSIVTPGFIDTPMTDNHHGPTPMIVSASRAARLIRKGLDGRRNYIAFPLSLVLLTRLWSLLPAPLADWISQFIRADIVDPELDTEL